MRERVVDWVGLLARLVVGGVWIVAGGVKLPDIASSVDAVRAYQLLPEEVVPTVGQLLPVLEVVIGATLVVGLLTRASAVLSAVLFAAFIVGIASAWARGLTIDCGCFGGGGYDPDAVEKYPWEIGRDTALLIASLFLVAFGHRSRWALDHVLFRRTPGAIGRHDEARPDPTP